MCFFGSSSFFFSFLICWDLVEEQGTSILSETPAGIWPCGGARLLGAGREQHPGPAQAGLLGMRLHSACGQWATGCINLGEQHCWSPLL